MDTHETPQPEGSERRVLFLFDEFNKLRTFQPAEDAALYKRSSYIKCWFIVQNVGQLYANYTNANNFLGNCDKQFFGIDRTDTEVLDLITKSLGGYVDPNRDGKEDDSRYSEFKRDLLENSAISELLNIKGNKQLLITVGGKPLLLKRIPYYKIFSKSSYGEHEKKS